MKTKLTLLLCLLICFAVKAQDASPKNRIIVLGQATVNVPADQLKFYVMLESVDSTNVERVYQKHQAQEQKLVKLLQELKLPSSDISYSMFSLSQRQDLINRQRVIYYVGRQSVTFTITKLSELPAIQARLIKEGFTNFNSSFTSTKIKQHETEALQKAIGDAKSKAETMATAADRKLKQIVNISDIEAAGMAMRLAGREGLYERIETSYATQNLTEFPQTIPVVATVKVVFELK